MAARRMGPPRCLGEWRNGVLGLVTGGDVGGKAGKGEKVCRVKMQYSGEVKSWVCKTQEPFRVWHEINYVKCGSTITGCL